jgi:hypothetical protein
MNLIFQVAVKGRKSQSWTLDFKAASRLSSCPINVGRFAFHQCLGQGQKSLCLKQPSMK